MMREEKWLLEEKYGGFVNPRFEEDKKRLAKGEPLGYVIGWQPFLGLKIHLDSKPLIPRPETEWWVDRLLANLEAGSPLGGPASKLKFLDLCAGSGAIGCAALARLPKARVSFGEADPAHEATIRKNIRENHLDETSADIRIGDLFEPFGDMRFDVIASNPPYVPSRRTLPPSVARYEPSLALLAGEGGLDVIRRIATAVRRRLTETGTAWIECDCGHAEDARALFAAEGLAAQIRTDQYGKPRFLVCRHTRARSAQ